MKLLELTLDNPVANVALDEALLEQAESGASNAEILRMWQPENPLLVLGRSSPVGREANQSQCLEWGVPIVRRCSGGSAILTDRGCLMYSVLLDCRRRPELRSIDRAHRFVMQRIRQAISNCGVECQLQGICDLTIDDKKISGNALRCKKNWLLYHGTLICEGMNLTLISRCLGKPQREPAYRRQRSHADFVTSLPLDTTKLAGSMIRTWACDDSICDWPEQMTDALVHEKYSRDQWNLKI